MKLLRFSGIRLDKTSPTYVQQYEILVRKATEALTPIHAEARKEPFLYQDHIVNAPLQDLLAAFLAIGELYLFEDQGNTFGYALFREILPRHKAKFEIYLAPAYRKTYIWKELRQVLDKMAFAPFPEGLELKKLCAVVHPANISSIRACLRHGFVPLCESLFEALFKGNYTSMIFLDLYPPEVRQLSQPQVIENGRRLNSISHSAAGADISSAPVVHSGTVNKQPSGDIVAGTVDIPERTGAAVPEREPVGSVKLSDGQVLAAPAKHVGKPRRAVLTPAKS